MDSNQRERPPADGDRSASASSAAATLGPLIVTVRCHTREQRAIWFLVLLGTGALLTAAAMLKPDPSGVGTHKQLGMPGCTSIVMFGFPCPTCGMTTAFAHAVRGQVVDAWHAQPAGLVLALLTMLLFLNAGRCVFRGRFWRPNPYRVSLARVGILVVLLILSGWGYKLLTFNGSTVP